VLDHREGRPVARQVRGPAPLDQHLGQGHEPISTILGKIEPEFFQRGA
jgi:hypothetical protein